MVAVSEQSPVVYVAAWEMEGDPAPVVASAAQKAAARGPEPEFAGAMWLTRQPGFGPPQASGEAADVPCTERIVEWIQWSSAPSLPLSALSVIATARPDAGAGGATCEHEGLYTVKGVVTASGSGDLVITPGAGGITLMLMGSSDKSAWACDFVMDEARENIRFLPGFIGGAFLLGHDGSRLAELVRWESMSAFRNATTNERFRQRIAEAGSLGVIDGASYRALAERVA
jgi:hypothetical protein